MGEKITSQKKKNSPKDPLPKDGLTYQTDNSQWGLAAFSEGQKLAFSGCFSVARVRRENWQNLFSIFKLKRNPWQTKGPVDVYKLFSPRARRAWNNACSSAHSRGGELGVEDIFLALLKEPAVRNLLSRLKLSTTEATILLNNYLKLKPADSGDAVKKIPFEAFALALKLHDHKVGSLMLLGALLIASPKDNILQAIFTNIGLTLEKLELFSVWILNLNYELPPTSPGFRFLYCCRQAESLEEHLGYFFELPAIEAAVNLSAGQSLKDLQHKKALQLLVRAANLARAKNQNVISESFVRQAAL